jgi:hypothetical protein
MIQLVHLLVCITQWIFKMRGATIKTLAAGLYYSCFSDIVQHLHKQRSQVSVYSFHISVYLHPSRIGPFNEIHIAKTVQKFERPTSETWFVSTLCSKIDCHITFIYYKSKSWKFTEVFPIKTDTSQRVWRYVNGVYDYARNLMVIVFRKFSNSVSAKRYRSFWSQCAQQCNTNGGIWTCKILRFYRGIQRYMVLTVRNTCNPNKSRNENGSN